MLAPIPSQITTLLRSIVDPYLGQDLVSAKIIQEIAIGDGKIALRLQYPYPVSNQIEQIKSQIKEIVHDQWPHFDLLIDIKTQIKRHKVQKELKPKSGIKNIIAVASGKGGVGKSTVAVNLAMALSHCGAKVALVDADIYGPSLPRLVGQQNIRAQTADKKFIPIVVNGVQTISIGYLVDELNALIWRGPMVSGALQQLVNDTHWEPCDYMIIDLPPGTGDIQLTLAQKIPISGAVVVTTPQDIALLDAKRAIKMFEKVEVPVLGIVENMSTHICSGCGFEEAVFGKGGGERMAAEFNVPLVAQLPLDSRIRFQSDEGMPIAATTDLSDPLACKYWEMAQKVSAILAQREVDYTAPIGITVSV